MPAYWIAHARIKDPEGYRRYGELAAPAVAAHEHRILTRGSRIEMLEGTKAFDRFVVVEFPSRQVALACYASEAYQRAAVIRRQAAEDCQLMIVDGV
jgi:uncharacterized protein (DUF1330 family)